MPNARTTLKSEVKVFDIYYEMLTRRIAPMLEVLLALCPDEPLGPPEGVVTVKIPGKGKVRHARTHWPEQQQFLHVLFPGYQPGNKFRDSMKYDNQPDDGAPLAESIRAALKYSKADWSWELKTGRTTLQFRDWLPLYLNEVTPSMPLWLVVEGWVDAFQILRLACGLPLIDFAGGGK